MPQELEFVTDTVENYNSRISKGSLSRGVDSFIFFKVPSSGINHDIGSNQEI